MGTETLFICNLDYLDLDIDLKEAEKLCGKCIRCGGIIRLESNPLSAMCGACEDLVNNDE